MIQNLLALFARSLLIPIFNIEPSITISFTEQQKQSSLRSASGEGKSVCFFQGGVTA